MLGDTSQGREQIQVVRGLPVVMGVPRNLALEEQDVLLLHLSAMMILSFQKNVVPIHLLSERLKESLPLLLSLKGNG